MQQPPDTGQQQPPFARRRTSSIPRPAVALVTNGDSFRANGQASAISSAQTLTPEAVNFYKTRKPVPATSGATTGPQSSSNRPTIRSASGPQLKSAASSPTISRPNRMEGSSIRDLVARFNDPGDISTQVRPHRPRPGPREHGPDYNAITGEPMSAVEPPSSGNWRMNNYPRSRQPPNGTSRSFGFESISDDRREYSHIPRPSTADHSRQAPPQNGIRTPLFGEVIPGQSDLSNGGYGIQPHRRRRGSEGSMRSPTSTLSAHRDGPFPPHKQQYTASPPQSRIPVPKPTSGYPSANNSFSYSNGPGGQPPSTPPSSIRPSGALESRSGQSSGGTQSLRAIINAPVPQKSPPLRSSRPRQDVNSARSISPTYDRSRHRVNLDGSPRRPNVPSGMDVMTRQDSIRKALRADRPMDTAVPHLAHNRNMPSPSSNRRQLLLQDPSAQEESLSGAKESFVQLPTTTYQRQDLRLQVHDIAHSQDDEAPNTGITQFEEDESPVLEVPGSFPDTHTPDPKQSDPLNDLRSEKTDPKPGSIALDPLHNRSRTVLSQVLEMRGDGNTVASTPAIGSPSLDKDEAGTIQIMLGNTPAQESAGSDWYRRELHRGTDEAGAIPTPGGLAPSNNSPSVRSPSAWTPPRSDDDRASQLTHESDSYTAINRILDQYHQSGVVSPEMVQEFQQYIMEVEPDLNGSDQDESMIVARTALEDIIRDHTRAAILAGEAGGNIYPKSHDGSPPSPIRYEADPRANTFAVDWPNPTQSSFEPSIDPQASAAAVVVPSVNNALLGRFDEEGPTPPPKDVDFASPIDRAGENLAPPVPSVAPEKPLLPETPRTDGSLGLTIAPTSSSTSTITQSTSISTTDSQSVKPARSAEFLAPGPQRADVTAQPGSVASSSKTSLTTPAHSFREEFTVAGGTADAHDSAIGSRGTSMEKDKDSSGSPPPADPNMRRLIKRRHLIKELVDTEASYNQDMKVIEDIYKGTANACEAVTSDDRRVLFGNSSQIVTFSENFLAALKKAGASVYVMPPSHKWRQGRNSFSTSNSAKETDDTSLTATEPTDDERDRKTFIGETFTQHMAQMEEIYTNYLRNHDYANQRLKKLQEISKVKLWLNECHTYAADITSAWDLDSLLVKPVQRILKYPLLLKSLLECTLDDHPDFPALKKAVKEMMDASYRINESKKRAEVLDQVMRNTKRKDFDISKLVGRRTDKLRQQVGLSEAVEDADYKKLAQRFETRYVHLQIVMRDFEVYKKSTEDFMVQFEQLMRSVDEMVTVGRSHSPELESKWRKLILTIREMHSIAHADHDAAIARHCIEPIVSLIKLHEGPQKLMMKRKKRIVEYAKFFTMKNRGEKVDKKTQEQGEQFIALNETLKDELPKLFNLSSQLIDVCVKNFVDLQVHWHSIWQRKVKAILEDQEIPKDLADIVTAFNGDFSYVEAHVLSLGICNGSVLADVSNFLSSSGASFATDDTSSTKRPSMQKAATAAAGEHSPIVPDRRSEGSFANGPAYSARSSSESQLRNLQSNPQSQTQERFRASSNVSSQSARNPSRSVMTGGAPYVPHQESRQNRPSEVPPILHSAPQATGLRTSSSSTQSQVVNPGRPVSSSTFYSASAGPSPHVGHQRSGSGAFSSAMPMSDSPSTTRPHSPNTAPGQREYQTLFLAASLYDFNIDSERSEAGYPYLFYTPGEVFDVIGQKGELWLAKNQDDPAQRIGWIWEKHFAKLMSEE